MCSRFPGCPHDIIVLCAAGQVIVQLQEITCVSTPGTRFTPPSSPTKANLEPTLSRPSAATNVFGEAEVKARRDKLWRNRNKSGHSCPAVTLRSGVRGEDERMAEARKSVKCLNKTA
uniref:Uncharacterized protein n=1 Tax=Lygus hesperus TaxID=30085 RepID=A0A0K8S8H6_LYGHE